MGNVNCVFSSPDLIRSVSGSITPTFAVDPTNNGYLTAVGSLTTATASGQECAFPTGDIAGGQFFSQAVTPFLEISGARTSCNTMIPTDGASAAYFRGVTCPSVTLSALPTGTYTLGFVVDPAVNGIDTNTYSISSNVFVLTTPLPSVATTTTTTSTTTLVASPAATVTQTTTISTDSTTVTLPAVASSTSTSTVFSSTITETASTTISASLSRADATVTVTTGTITVTSGKTATRTITVYSKTITETDTTTSTKTTCQATITKSVTSCRKPHNYGYTKRNVRRGAALMGTGGHPDYTYPPLPSTQTVTTTTTDTPLPSGTTTITTTMSSTVTIDQTPTSGVMIITKTTNTITTSTVTVTATDGKNDPTTADVIGTVTESSDGTATYAVTTKKTVHTAVTKVKTLAGSTKTVTTTGCFHKYF